MGDTHELLFRYYPYGATQKDGSVNRKLAEGGFTREDGQSEQIERLRKKSHRWKISNQIVPFCQDCLFQPVYSCDRMRVENEQFIDGATTAQVILGNAYCSETPCQHPIYNGETLPQHAPCRNPDGVSNVPLQITRVQTAS